MTMMQKQALLHMGKALDFLDLDIVCPASCFLQMAIDLVKENLASDTISPPLHFDHAFMPAISHDIGMAE